MVKRTLSTYEDLVEKHQINALYKLYGYVRKL